MGLDRLRESAIFFSLRCIYILSILLRIIEQFLVAGAWDTIRYLQVVILNDEGAPREVEVRLTVVDSFTKLFSDWVDDEKYFFFVSFEIFRLLFRENQVLAVSYFSNFGDKKDYCDCKRNFEISSDHHEHTNVHVVEISWLRQSHLDQIHGDQGKN